MKLNWLVIENIALWIVFCFLVFALDGWAKTWAIAPLMFMNFITTKKVEAENGE